MKNINKISFRNLYAFGTKLPIDLSLSENPLGCSPRVLKIIQNLQAVDIFDYPDPNLTAVCRVISTNLKVDEDKIFIANGSESIIKLVPQVILKPSEEVLIPELTFPMFKESILMSKGRVVECPMSKDLDIDLSCIKAKLTSETKIVFICNPNNPTGKVISKRKLLNFVENTKCLVIVDEANIEFGGDSLIKEASITDNLLVLRTFSKGLGLAGLRIGFCVGNKDLIESLKDSSPPFTVNKVAQLAAITALTDRSFIRKTKLFMDNQRQFLTLELIQRGFKVIPSLANNMFIDTNDVMDTSLFITELNSLGVSVVSGSSFGPKWKEFVRVSPRLERTNREFLKVIDKILMVK